MPAHRTSPEALKVATIPLHYQALASN